MMGSLLCNYGRKDDVIDSHDKAVLDLKFQRDKLLQYQQRLTKIAEREKQVAKHCISSGRRRQALLALRKKRLQEQMLEKSFALLQNVQEMIDSIEFAKIELQVFERLKDGNQVLSELQEQMKLSDVECLMDDTQEAIARQREIDELLTGQLSIEDEEACEEELDALIQESFPKVPEEGIPEEVPVGQLLPSVPIANSQDSHDAQTKIAVEGA